MKKILLTAAVLALARGAWALELQGLTAGGATGYYRQTATKESWPGIFDGINLEACPGARELGPDSALCRVPGAEALHRLRPRREHQVESLPFGGWDAVSLNILPDDSTNRLYEYSYELRRADGSLAGYAQRQGYANDEAQVRLDLLLRYDKEGALASVTVI